MSDNEASSPNHRESSHESQRSRSHAKKKPRGHSESRALSEETGSDRGKTRSRTGSISPVRSRSRSSKRSRSRGSRSRRRRTYSRSRSRSYSKKYKRRSRSRSRKKYHSRSRSYSYSRSRGRDYYRSRSRSPLSNRRRHVGSRENPPSGRCLGVFGMSLYTRERDLKEVFSRYGKVEQVNIVYDQTGRSRGFAFVYFENSEDAQEARERCNGSEVDGRRIRVDFSITQRAHTPTPGVYMGKPTNSRYNRRSSSPYRHNRYSRSKSRSYSRSPRRY